jgi:hypothetical protein
MSPIVVDAGALFAVSCAVSCHLLSKRHHAVTKGWYENKWFWAGFFGTLPALVAFVGHIFLSRKT